MRIVIALDSFKGTLSAAEACTIVRDGLLAELPHLDIILKPMADGGEGTAAAIVAARNGTWEMREVTGPLEELRVEGRFGWFSDDASAVLEMASASGLPLLRADQLKPLVTTTYGTGELLARAAEMGAQRIWMGVGGSATIDGGVGAAMALGWKFLDAKGVSVGVGGGELERIHRIEPPPVDVLPVIEVLCDVDNPLFGTRGAPRVYGPQKGATPEMVERLDGGLRHLAACVKQQLGTDVADLPGAGAAGGLAAGAVAFMNAGLVSGIDTVMRETGFEEALDGAAWVITGEGRFDHQSLQGKVVSGVSRLAREAGTAVAVIAGSVQLDRDAYEAAGIRAALGTGIEGKPLSYNIEHAGDLLHEAAQRFAREHLQSC